MKFEGTIYKDKGFWLIEIPLLDLMTQSTSKAEAYEMAYAIVFDAIGDNNLIINIEKSGTRNFYVSSPNTKKLIAFMLKRQRLKKGLTIREASKKMGSRSPNAYGVYEQGKSAPTIDKLEQLLKAVDDSLEPILKVG